MRTKSRRGEPKLVPPGQRKKTPYYVIRYYQGRKDHEYSTGTDDPAVAQQIYDDFCYNLKAKKKAKEIKSFRFAADSYIAWRNPSKRELGFIDMLCSITNLGDKPINEVDQNDLVEVANKRYPTGKGSSKNRAVMHPASAIIHYASKPPHRWCERWEVALFDEATVKKRAVDIDVARKLIAATFDIERLLMLWLFKHSDRITGTLSVEGAHIHMNEGHYDRLTGKRKKVWQKAPLDSEVKAALVAEFGDKLPSGRIFPWLDRWAVYDWLTPKCKKLGIDFTPHAARHSILSWIGNSGGNSHQIKTRAGHSSLKSSEPYLAEDLEATSAITAKFVLVKPRTRGATRGQASRKVRKHA